MQTATQTTTQTQAAASELTATIGEATASAAAAPGTTHDVGTCQRMAEFWRQTALRILASNRRLTSRQRQAVEACQEAATCWQVEVERHWTVGVALRRQAQPCDRCGGLGHVGGCRRCGAHPQQH